MNTLLLTPSDTLFFRDGRPMSGSLGGHGAAWPLPNVTNAALHAALWRAGDTFTTAHRHRRGRSGAWDDGHRDRKFGSLITAGPFPVLDGTWMFPRPLDAALAENGCQATLLPLAQGFDRDRSSLPAPLRYAVANTQGPTKQQPRPWWNRSAWHAYAGIPDTDASPEFCNDDCFSDTEFSYGIGIDPERGTQDGERFYSAHSLRLKPDCQLGLLAQAEDKEFKNESGSNDLIQSLFPETGKATPIIVGGQQRLSSVTRERPSTLPLPLGKTSGFAQKGADGNVAYLVKWVLLSPAVFPLIEAGISKRGTARKAHHGGWLPTWICPDTGNVLLQVVDEAERKRRRHLNTAGKGYESHPDIPAQLVAALVGKAVPVTGYALPHETTGSAGGSKPTHLAVPAGSVYYFQCKEEEDARKLAAALNWHGSGDGSRIANRRSTLFGEKGFGLGICGTWRFHDVPIPA